MRCPRDDCGSSNIQSLSLYWLGLPNESASKRTYAQPAEGDRRARLIAAAAALAGLVMAVTGTVGVGLSVLAAASVATWVLHGRIIAAETARSAWQQRRICLACKNLWVPK